MYTCETIATIHSINISVTLNGLLPHPSDLRYSVVVSGQDGVWNLSSSHPSCVTETPYLCLAPPASPSSDKSGGLHAKWNEPDLWGQTLHGTTYMRNLKSSNSQGQGAGCWLPLSFSWYSDKDREEHRASAALLARAPGRGFISLSLFYYSLGSAENGALNW